MFNKVTSDLLDTFRIIYHQTTGYCNPIIEAVLYQNRKECGMYFWGDLRDGNYLIFHRSGFAHINFNLFNRNITDDVIEEFDEFFKNEPLIPEYLMFFNTPEKLINYWKGQDKKHFQVRKRRRYQVDEMRFMSLDKSFFTIPKKHELCPIQQCPFEDLKSFDPNIDSKFYDSKEDLLENSFGYVLYDEDRKPASFIYLMCLVGRNGEFSVMTLPEFRNKGYGHLLTLICARESISRNIDFGWDIFAANHPNEWIQKHNYGYIIREYDFVSFLK